MESQPEDGPLVLEIDKPHFTVELHKEILKVHMKDGFKKDIEEVVEARPILRDTLGFLSQWAAPIDVPLHLIESTKMEKDGLKIVISHRKDITIPLSPEEASRLVEALNDIVPEAKEEEDVKAVVQHQAEERKEANFEEGLSLTGRR